MAPGFAFGREPGGVGRRGRGRRPAWAPPARRTGSASWPS